VQRSPQLKVRIARGPVGLRVAHRWAHAVDLQLRRLPTVEQGRRPLRLSAEKPHRRAPPRL